jgi:hypothetical protein
MDLQEFDFQIHHLKRTENIVVDTLSRYPEECGDCTEIIVCVLKPTRYSTEEFALWQQGDDSIKAPALRLQGLMKDVTLKEREGGIFRLAKEVLYEINTTGKGRKNSVVDPKKRHR